MCSTRRTLATTSISIARSRGQPGLGSEAICDESLGSTSVSIVKPGMYRHLCGLTQ